VVGTIIKEPSEQVFHGQDAVPLTQPAVSECLRELVALKPNSKIQSMAWPHPFVI